MTFFGIFVNPGNVDPSPTAAAAPRRDAILDAAFRRFAAYGYRRVSLGDIAEEAGMSRPALYHYFRDKEDVFRAVSERIQRGVVEAVTAAAATPGSVEERLAAVLAARVGWAFDLLHVSAHGRELIDEKNRLCGSAGGETNAKFAALVERILESGVRRGEIALKPSRLTSASAAKFLIDCLQGLLENETTEAVARERLRVLTRIFVAGLAPTSRG